uniref:Uncharacterized protein n=1 Tax=Vespula pensylvanica TaxID=30213 RepID=A0A834PH22_VESPE|nr:hypothetical protein H0235_002018 [Vespula pensylvanica]
MISAVPRSEQISAVTPSKNTLSLAPSLSFLSPSLAFLLRTSCSHPTAGRLRLVCTTRQGREGQRRRRRRRVDETRIHIVNATLRAVAAHRTPTTEIPKEL